MSNPVDPVLGSSPVLDRHIRAALISRLSADRNAVIFQELPLLRGDGRADVVSVNGYIAGFEIKSERDSLARLSEQVENYETICEFATAVVAPRHLKAARQTLPTWWGIVVAFPDLYGGVSLRDERLPKRRTRLDRAALTRLLWKEECARILRQYGNPPRPGTLVHELWQGLDLLPPRALLAEVRCALKARRGSESAGS